MEGSRGTQEAEEAAEAEEAEAEENEDEDEKEAEAQWQRVPTTIDDDGDEQGSSWLTIDGLKHVSDYMAGKLKTKVAEQKAAA